MKYCDRQGRCWEENSFQDRLLKILYGCLPGRVLIKCLTFPAVSKFGGRLLSSGFSTILINPFVKANHICMDDYISQHYYSYNDFFKRKIRPSKRPINRDGDVLISPCDGKVSVFPIDAKSRFMIKNSPYTVKTLTRSARLAKKYEGGYCVLIRLTVDDYHRYCYVEDGIKSRNYKIPGCFHTVNPAAVATVPVYKENTRSFTIIRTKTFGDILQMEVGALMVGKITNYHGRRQVCRGMEKGCFEFGGSTVILLLEKDRVAIDRDLLYNTENDCETVVEMGQQIGKKYKG